MKPGRLLRAARRRSGKSQRQLATACGIPQATIARIESGAVDPRFGTLLRLLRACGYDLETTPLLGEGIDRTHIRALLDLTPAERLSHAAQGAAVLAALDSTAGQLRAGAGVAAVPHPNMTPGDDASDEPRPSRPRAAFDPQRLLSMLDGHGVSYIVIGGIAARVHGSPSLTDDLDICYERTRPNMAALASALRELGAELKGAEPGLPFLLDARTIEMGDHFTFETDAGGLDCLGRPAGAAGYGDLIRDAVAVDAFGRKVRFTSLDDLIRMKRAAGRPKDRIELEVLGALREEIDARETR